MRIHSVSEGRMVKLKALVQDDTFSKSGRVQKKQRINPAYESVTKFLTYYFSDANGRCEKMPNPRSSRDEYRLPSWLNRSLLYTFYKEDCETIGGGGFT